MHKKGPEAFRDWLKHRANNAPNQNDLGANRELGKKASRFGISTETARSILLSEGWRLVPTSSKALKRWHPPEEGG